MSKVELSDKGIAEAFESHEKVLQLFRDARKGVSKLSREVTPKTVIKTVKKGVLKSETVGDDELFSTAWYR